MGERCPISPWFRDRKRFARLGRQRGALERRGLPVPDVLVEEQHQLDQRLAQTAPWWKPHFETNRSIYDDTVSE